MGDVAWLSSARPGCGQTYLNKDSPPQRGLVGGRVQLFVCVHSTMAWNTGRCIHRGAEKRDRQIDPALYATTVWVAKLLCCLASDYLCYRAPQWVFSLENIVGQEKGANKDFPWWLPVMTQPSENTHSTIWHVRPRGLCYFKKKKKKKRSQVKTANVCCETLQCIVLYYSCPEWPLVRGERWQFQLTLGKLDRRPSQLEDSEGHRVPWAGEIPKGVGRWSLEWECSQTGGWLSPSFCHCRQAGGLSLPQSPLKGHLHMATLHPPTGVPSHRIYTVCTRAHVPTYAHITKRLLTPRGAQSSPAPGDWA